MPHKRPLGRRKPKKPASPPPPLEAKAQAKAKSAPAAREANGSPAISDWDDFTDKASLRLEETAQKATDAARKATVEAKKIALDLSEGAEKAFGKLRTEAEHMVKRGQHTRVRIKFRGKQIAELPVAVVAAGEIASLVFAGPLKLVLAHFVGKAVLEVEFVNDAQSHVAAGRAFVSSGDLVDALREFDRALEMDRKSAGAHLGRGIALKLRGEKDAARAAFVLAEECDPRGDSGREARRHLDNL